MITIQPSGIPTPEFHAHLLNAVAPRPIALASTVDREGRNNLSPFSFFNVFGVKPPVLIFSPARKVRDNTEKHTLENIRETREVVINVVNYAMVQQTSLASCEYPKGVDEFVKAGFTPLKSEQVKPFRVSESPVQFECRVLEVIETGKEGGAGNLVICEIMLMHIHESVLNSEGKIDPDMIDLVGRCGGDFYCRASGSAIFTVPKPNRKPGIGLDQIPAHIRESEVLTGNDLGQLGNIDVLPTEEEVTAFINMEAIRNLNASLLESPSTHHLALHLAAKELIRAGEIKEAWMLLLGLSKK